MEKTTVKTIKKGRRRPRFSLFDLRITNRISFTFSLSSAARYDNAKVLNAWHRIIGLSTIRKRHSSIEVAFISNGYGLQAAFILWRDGKRTVCAAGPIQANTPYGVDITYNPESANYCISLACFSDVKNYYFPANNHWLTHLVTYPRLGGKFTLDDDLTISLTRHGL